MAEDAGRHRVELDSGDLALGAELRRHGRDEVANAGGGLDDAWPLQIAEAELEDSLPDRGDQVEGRVEGGEGGDAQMLRVVGGEEGSVAIVKDVAASRWVVAEQPVEQGRLAEGAVMRQDTPLLAGRRAALSLELMRQLERGEVLLEAVARAAVAQGVGREVKGLRAGQCRHSSAPAHRRKPAVGRSRRLGGVIAPACAALALPERPHLCGAASETRRRARSHRLGRGVEGNRMGRYAALTGM
jgi:hypothetical protein